jgi:hypothetical protein
LSVRAEEARETEARISASRERKAARDAAFRVQDTSSDTRSVYAGFGHVQKSSAASTIVDLLAGILR